MPCYLAHGFRWPRRSIRIHVIMENIDDAAPEYLIEPETSRAVLETFKEKWPEEMAHLPHLRFIEQYDPQDVSSHALSQPHAFVVDKFKDFNLSLNVHDGLEEMAGSLSDRQLVDALEKLRDHLAPGERIGWWVVYNGDEPRLHERSEQQQQQHRQQEEDTSGSLRSTLADSSPGNEQASTSSNQRKEKKKRPRRTKSLMKLFKIGSRGSNGSN